MICKRLDQSLLLLAHGALAAPARLYVGAHLRCCPSCQARYKRLVATSVGIADELRGASLPAWTPQPIPVWSSPVAARPTLTARLAIMLCLLAFLSVTAVAATAYRWYTAPAASEYCTPEAASPMFCTGEKAITPASAPAAAPIVTPPPVTTNVTPWKGPALLSGSKKNCLRPRIKKESQ